MPFIVVIVALAGLGIVWLIRRAGAKEKTARARVLGREERAHQLQGKEDDSPPTERLVRFAVDGKTLELQVSRAMYESAKEGLEGTLQYKGHVFIEFEPDNSRPW